MKLITIILMSFLLMSGAFAASQKPGWGDINTTQTFPTDLDLGVNDLTANAVYSGGELQRNQTQVQSVTVLLRGSDVVVQNSTGHDIYVGNFSAAMNYSVANYKSIALAGDTTFTATTKIAGFPLSYTSYVEVPTVISGSGGTNIVYSGNDRLFSISSQGVGDARTVNGVVLRDFRIDISGSSSATGIEYVGACFSQLNNVEIYGNTGTTAVSASPNSYGSASLLNYITNGIFNIHRYGIKQNANTQFVVKDCQVTGCSNAIYSSGVNNFVWISDTQLSTVNATDRAIYLVGGVNNFANIYVDSGQIYTSGGRASFYGGHILMPTAIETDLYLSKDTEVFGGVWNNTDVGYRADFFPMTIEAENANMDDDYGAIVNDSLASNGKSRKNSITNATNIFLLAGFHSGYFNTLPRGKYVGIFRAKDTNQVADDCKILVWNIEDTTYPLIKSYTLTANYAEYPFEFVINGDDAGDRMQIAFVKDKVTNNTISIDFLELDRVGDERQSGYITSNLLNSPDGSLFKLAVANDGTVSAVEV